MHAKHGFAYIISLPMQLFVWPKFHFSLIHAHVSFYLIWRNHWTCVWVYHHMCCALYAHKWSNYVVIKLESHWPHIPYLHVPHLEHINCDVHRFCIWGDFKCNSDIDCWICASVNKNTGRSNIRSINRKFQLWHMIVYKVYFEYSKLNYQQVQRETNRFTI